MSLQERPICFSCQEEIDTVSVVFESICGHVACPSAVFHGLCLMSWRERRQEIIKMLQRFVAEHPELEMIEIEEDDL